MRIIKRIKITCFIVYVFLYTVLIIFNSKAGNLIASESFIMYKNDYGEIAKDTWVWIDTDKDSIAECYRFDELGQLAINYKDKYGRTTNENGQLIENGEVIRKMLSSGEILNSKEAPANGIIEFIGNIINPKPKYEKDKWTNKSVEVKVYETNTIDETIDGKVIYANSDKNEIDILNGESAESGTIYANGKASEISDGVEDNRDIVAGKDFRRFISSKNKCTEKVSSAYIYGGKTWVDVLSLNGNGATVKFTLNGNNYIRFEVAHSNHSEEEKDTDITLDMYVDGKLHDSFDEFVDGEPQVVEEYLENAKTVELKVNIVSGSIGRTIYIRNGRLKKVKTKDE